MLLAGKVAVLFGGGGRTGASVARAFAAQGAWVHLAGRTRERLEAVAEDVRRAGGRADAEVLDVLEERAVEAFAERVVARSGRIDVAFNLVGYGEVREPLTDIWVEDLTQPVLTAMRGHLLTTRAATRHMVRTGGGVVLAHGGADGPTLPGLGGFRVALDAVEALRRQWACELGPYGVRFVTLKPVGGPAGNGAGPGPFRPGEVGVAELPGGVVLPEAVAVVAVSAAAEALRTLPARRPQE